MGRVLREKGYGFILDDNGGEVYFQRNAMHDLNFDELEEGGQSGAEGNDPALGGRVIPWL